MKSKQSTKHKKQRKKEKANRKAKQEQGQTVAEQPVLKEPEYPPEDRSAEVQPDTVPMSPARRAFQDI